MPDRIQVSTTNNTTLQMTVRSNGVLVPDGTEVKLEIGLISYATIATTLAGVVDFLVPALASQQNYNLIDATVRVGSSFPIILTLEAQEEGAEWVGGIDVSDDGITYYTGTAASIPGPEGPEGPPGQGVPAEGTTGQVLAKASGDDYDTEWVNPGGGAQNLGDLGDVEIAGAQDGQVLGYDGSDWVPVDQTGGDTNPQYVYGDASILAEMVTGNAKVTMLGDSIMNDGNTTFTTLYQAAAFCWKPEKWGGIWHNVNGALGKGNTISNGGQNFVTSVPGNPDAWYPGLASATGGYGKAGESKGVSSRMFDLGFDTDNLSTAAADHLGRVAARFPDGYGCFQLRGGGRDIATNANQAVFKALFNIGNDTDYQPSASMNMYNPGSSLQTGFQTSSFTGSGRRLELLTITLSDPTNYTGSENDDWDIQIRGELVNTNRLAIEKQYFGGTDDGMTLGYIGDGGWRTRNHYPPGETITTSNGTKAYHYDAQYLNERLDFEGTTHAVIFLGMNDISGADRDGATVFADLQTVIANTKVARPDVKIVLYTMYPGVLDDADKLQAKDDLNALIKALPDTDPDVVVYDLGGFIDDQFPSDSAFWAAWLNDNTHPNVTGAIAMMEDFWLRCDQSAYPPTAAVDSVNGQTGTVVLTGDDIDTSGTDPTSLASSLTSLGGLVVANASAIASLDSDKPDSVSEGGGTDAIENIVSCTQGEYDLLTPVATTFYIITGP